MGESINIYELLYFARCQNDLALEMLIEQFQPLIYRLYKDFHSKFDLLDYDELYSAALAGLYNAIAHYREDKDCSFSGFVSICINNEMMNVYRLKIRKAYNKGLGIISLDNHLKDNEMITYGEVIAKPNSDPLQYIYQQAIVEEIDKEIKKELDRKILQYRIEGYSYQQIAQSLGISTKRVDNTLQRIKKKISYLFD